MAVDIDALREFEFLQPLDEDELAQLAEQVEERHYPARALIFPDGTIGDRLYLVKEGRVQILKPAAEGELLLNEMVAGDTFGEMSLLDGQPRSATARAVEDVSVLEIPKETFLSLIQHWPMLLYQTAQQNIQRLRRSDLARIRELELRNAELGDLYETSLDISRHLELQKLLAALADRATKLLNGASGELHLYDSQKRMLVPHISDEFVRPGVGTTGIAFSSAEPVIRNVRGKKYRAGARCELAAPIRLDETALGTLTIYRPPDGTPFDTDDAQLLKLFANVAAIAIENARLYELAVEKGRLDGELRGAHIVQRSLIPTRAPRIRGYHLATLWRPAREVAGDFNDFIPLAGGKWALVIADVSDKGMPAALFMAVSRSTLRASLAAEPDPARALEHTNRILAAETSNAMFVTLFLAVLETKTKRLTYVNAGHNPPLLARAASGKIEYLSERELAAGIDPNIHYTSRVAELSAGDQLVLYTDGVTEAMNEQDEFFDLPRLADIVSQSPQADAFELVRAIDHGVNEFVGERHLLDDVTLLVLTVDPKK